MEKNIKNNRLKKEGILLVDKPSGITSHDVVDIARKRLHYRKIGHAGTLDPLAQGLLVLLVGPYTKMFSRFADFDKEYTGTLKLGETTSTGDSEGVVKERKDWHDISARRLEEAFESFQGPGSQIPPMVSALRKKGRRLYKLARQGVTVERKPRRINIYRCFLKQIHFPYADFYVHCSKGTYIRKFIEDLGSKLACGAHVTRIVRKKVGPFKLENSVKPEDINAVDLQEFTFPQD